MPPPAGGRAPASRVAASGGSHGSVAAETGQTGRRPPPHAGPRAERKEARMPTEAKQATVAELREELAKPGR